MRAETLQDYKTRLLRVLVHIQESLDEPLRLADLARRACFSPYHFHRIFRGMLGESLKSHIRRLRLERAAGQLKHGRLTVIDIALQAGYETHEAFTRAFKAQYALCPSKFRKLRNPRYFAPAPSGVHFTEGKNLRQFKTLLRGGNKMKVAIKSVPALRVAFLRHVGPYSTCGAAWEKLLPVLGKEGLIGGDALFIGICHDDPEVTPPERVRYDACVTVDAGFKARGEIGVQTVAGGEYAVTTHFGPYNRLGNTYAKLLGQWLPRSGRELRSTPCFEVYLNDPQSSEPEDLITDIYAPLVPLTPST